MGMEITPSLSTRDLAQNMDLVSNPSENFQDPAVAFDKVVRVVFETLLFGKLLDQLTGLP